MKAGGVLSYLAVLYCHVVCMTCVWVEVSSGESGEDQANVGVGVHFVGEMGLRVPLLKMAAGAPGGQGGGGLHIDSFRAIYGCGAMNSEVVRAASPLQRVA